MSVRSSAFRPSDVAPKPSIFLIMTMFFADFKFFAKNEKIGNFRRIGRNLDRKRLISCQFFQSAVATHDQDPSPYLPLLSLIILLLLPPSLSTLSYLSSLVKSLSLSLTPLTPLSLPADSLNLFHHLVISHSFAVLCLYRVSLFVPSLPLTPLSPSLSLSHEEPLSLSLSLSLSIPLIS